MSRVKERNGRIKEYEIKNMKIMDTNDLKRLIGSDCLVIDPRSKKKVFEPAKIISANYSIETINRSGEIYERISFGVELYKLTVTKRNRYGEVYEYHRSFNVSGDRIQIPSWHER